MNLPLDVEFNGSSSQTIHYTYVATGGKLRKEIPGKITDYAGNFVYEDLSGSMELQFFSTPEGYVSYANGQFNYVYNYVDHLGNVRLSYTDANGNGIIETGSIYSEIVQEKNYYPFGLTHKGYNGGGNGLGNTAAKRYGFGGKELQDETFSGNTLDWYDITARNYDPALGRWMNLDPLADYFQESTPYNYSHNSPLFFTDPTGLAPETIYRNIETHETVEVQDGVDKTLDVSNSAFQEAKFFANEINPSIETININGTDFEATVISVVSDDVADAYENFYDSHNSYDGASVSNLMDYAFGGPDLFREADLVQSGGGALDLIGGKKAIGSTAKALGLTARGVQKHHIIPKAIFKRFKKQLAPFMKLNAGVNLKKLPAPFHGNHPQYNKYVGNRIQALGRNGNINEGSLRALQKDLNSVLNKAYDSGQKLNEYFRQFN